jgi:hypothetical protein
MKRTLTLTALALILTQGLAAAEPPKLEEGKGQVVLSWNEFVKITGYDPGRKGAQVVTIPWEEVESLLGVKVDRISKQPTVELPWQDFKSLLQWSIDRKAIDAQGAAPPADYIITSSAFSGKIGEKAATFTRTLKLNVLRKDGWKRIAVLPDSVAIIESALPQGVYLNSAPGTYELLTQQSGPLEVSLTFSVAVTKSEGVNRVTIADPLRCTNLLDLTVASAGVDVKVAGAQSLTATSKQSETLVAAALPGGRAVDITWERALEKAPPAAPKLYAETNTLVAVADDLLLCQETVGYAILHSPVRELKLQVPTGVSILTVTGKGVEDWRVSEAGELSVALSREAIGSFDLQVAYEQVVKDGASAPVVRAVGVERERGFVGVVALANVEISPGQVAGARQIDVRQLPSAITSMTSQPVLVAFRYVGKELSLPLTIKKHGEVPVLMTIADSALYTAMQINDGRRMTKVIYSVRNNRDQFLRMKMPAGAEIWSASVGQKTVSPAKDQEGSVLIPLIRSDSQSRELASFPVELVYVEAPEKPAPTSGKIRVDLPTLAVPTMHVMVNCYLPTEGLYTVKGGFLGKDRSGFSGPLHVVSDFAAMAARPGAAAVAPVDAASQPQAMQQQMDRQMEEQARAGGAAPIRVKLPVNGKLFKLEKILVLKQDELYFEVQYRDWSPAN